MNTEYIIKELYPIDHFIEKRKVTLLFNDNKMLILQDFGNNEILFSFFIDKNLISTDIEDEAVFITKFKKYLNVVREKRNEILSEIL